MALLEKTKAPRLFDGGEIDRNDFFIPPVILDALLDDIVMEEEVNSGLGSLINTSNKQL